MEQNLQHRGKAPNVVDLTGHSCFPHGMSGEEGEEAATHFSVVEPVALAVVGAIPRGVYPTDVSDRQRDTF